ncbi:uncharacterized protein METZ01_LOCUS208156 [marine metagenome]|uniref:Uncharacterized protein n=1 Tax=marine metagenome TaxID=408172 RepID=A0A382EY65_9ZZZZ
MKCSIPQADNAANPKAIPTILDKVIIDAAVALYSSGQVSMTMKKSGAITKPKPKPANARLMDIWGSDMSNPH